MTDNILQLLSHRIEQNGNIVYDLNPNAMSVIEQWNGPIKIVVTIGPARTGKSYWNSMCVQQHEGANAGQFKVSDLASPCTTGVHFYSKPIQFQNVLVVVVDVEGTDLGNDTITATLSAFAVLIASTVIFMYPSVIDNILLTRLGIVTQFLDSMPNFEATIGLPHLALVLTRMHLAPSIGNQAVSLDEYLMDAISDKQPNDGLNANRARVRRFPTRKIFKMSPVHNLEADVSKCSSQIFKQEHAQIKQTIWESGPIKTFATGTPVNGLALTTLMKEFIKAANSKNVPSFPNMLDMVQEGLCTRESQILLQSSANINHFVINGDDVAAERVYQNMRTHVINGFRQIIANLHIQPAIIDEHVNQLEVHLRNLYGDQQAANNAFRLRIEADRARQRAEEADRQRIAAQRAAEEARQRAEEADRQRIAAEADRDRIEQENKRIVYTMEREQTKRAIYYHTGHWRSGSTFRHGGWTCCGRYDIPGNGCAVRWEYTMPEWRGDAKCKFM